MGNLFCLERRFADEIGFEGARTVVPLHALAVAIPQFQTMFLFAIFVAEIVLSPGYTQELHW